MEECENFMREILQNMLNITRIGAQVAELWFYVELLIWYLSCVIVVL